MNMSRVFGSQPRMRFLLGYLLAVGWASPLIAENRVTNVYNGTTFNFPSGYVLGTSGWYNVAIVTNGATFNAASVTVGVGAAAVSNRMVVTGIGTTLAGGVNLGVTGSYNVLEFRAGAQANVENLYAGLAAGSSNNVMLVTGTSLVSGLHFIVGSLGVANQVIVTNGSQISAMELRIGTNTTASRNSVVVAGAGSVWTNSFTCVVGDRGSGNQLIVASGGWVASAGSISVGNFWGGTCTNNSVLVTGADSLLSAGDELRLGNFGAFSQLTISNGGQVSVGRGSGLGVDTASSNNMALVTGTGSCWRSGTSFSVGSESSGNQLTISFGGRVESSWGNLGGVESASNNTVLVTGGGSAWTNTASLYVGRQGVGNHMVISAGGLVASSNAWVGYDATASSNVVEVTGAGSLWSTLTDVSVGGDGSANRLVVTNGGRVATASGHLLVGENSAGNLMVLGDGGLVANDDGYVGFHLGTLSNSVVVAGDGSVWTNRGDLHLGYRGAASQMTISNGGLVVARSASLGTYATSSNNVALVTGDNSGLSADSEIAVGRAGVGNRLSVSNGGVVAGLNGYLGYEPGSSNNSVVVTGSGATWSNRNSLIVGCGGASNLLAVAVGGLVVADNVVVGLEVGAINNAISVEGGSLCVTNASGASSLDVRRGSLVISAGSVFVDRLYATNGSSSVLQLNGGALTSGGTTFTNGLGFLIGDTVGGSAFTAAGGGHSFANNIEVGNSSTGNRMLVSAGAQVASSAGFLGDQSLARSNSVLVTGDGSVWTNRSSLYVGNSGSANTLAISNGGAVFNSYGYVGYGSSSSNNSLAVDGAGSLWNNDQNVFVGRGGPGNRASVSGGGVVVGDALYLGGLAGSDSNSVLVSGSGSLWTNRANLSVGDASSRNSLVISNGGGVVNSVAYIGNGSGATNNSVVVDGNGSFWTSRSALYVGYSGSSNRLTIQNGGTVVASNVSVGYLASADGNSIVVGDGSLVATNAAGSGFLNLLRGSLVVSGGTVAVDRLVATNSEGELRFNDGTLSLRGAIVNTGSRTSLGAAGGAVTLNLLGSTNRFEDGIELAGVAHSTGTVWLSGGRLLVTNANTYIGLSGVGAMTVSDGEWSARDVTVGRNDGSSGTVTLLGGTNTFSSYLSLGSLEQSTGAVLVAGGRLVVTNNVTYIGNLGVGRLTVSNGVWLAREVSVGNQAGSDGTLLAAGGSSLLTSNLWVGNAAGATGSLLVVGGELVTTNQGVFLGYAGLGQAVVSGGTWRVGSLVVGQTAGSTGLLTAAGGEILVTGAASASLEVRRGTLSLSGGSLTAVYLLATNGAGRLQLDDGTLSLGGSLVANAGTLAVGAAGKDAEVFFDGGTNRVVNSMLLGNVANSTGVVWLAGGQLVTTNDSYTVGVSGYGAMTASGGAWLARDVSVGFDAGSKGTLVLSGGTNRFLSTAMAGYNPGATGLVSLSGGELVTTNSSTTLGVMGRGQMAVSGGTWRAASILLGQNVGSTGTLGVAGGTILVTNSSASGTVELRRGTLALDGGTVTLDRLLATNAAGSFDFNGGTLSSRGTVVSNGAVFAVGDGAASAALNLLGGTHAFQNGVAVAPNAAVSGWGSVVGSLANTGAVATAGGELRLLGSVQGPGAWRAASGDTLSFVRGGTVAGFASTGATVRVEGSLTNTGAISNPNGLILVGPSGSNGVLNVTGGSVDGGTLVVGASGALKIAAAVDTMSSFLTNQGSFQPLADFFTLAGGFRNEAAFTSRNAQVIQVLNGFGNSGTVVLDTNSMLRVNGFGGQPQSGQIALRNGAILQSLALWTNSGTITVAKGSMIAGASVQNQSLLDGAGYVSAALGNRSGGIVRASNGVLTLGGVVTNFAGGTLGALSSSELALNNDLVNQGTVAPQGGSINLPYLNLTNSGTLSGYGTYRAGGIVNGGLASFSGGRVDIEAVYNNLGGKTTRVTSATARFFGAVSNQAGGVFKNTSGNFTFYDTFYNAGLYASDPATNVFSGDVVIGESGAISGGAGDVFQMGGDLTVLGSNGLDLAAATLQFGGGDHALSLVGTPTIGTLALDVGASLSILGADVHVVTLQFSTAQVMSAYNIYYDVASNPTLGGQTLTLTGGGFLVPIPEPGVVRFLLAALALAAVARWRR